LCPPARTFALRFVEAACAMEVRTGLTHETKADWVGSNPVTEIYVLYQYIVYIFSE
jgi:hypothetical protein